MHPEVVRIGPGSCPICGMALEPRDASVDDTGDPELREMTRRFWFSLPPSALVLFLAMGDMVFHGWVSGILPPRFMPWVQFALATPVTLWAGWPLLWRMASSLRTGRLNMFTLVGIGALAAWLYSAAATIFPHALPESFRGPDGVPEVYFEAAAVIVTLVLLGQVLELRARRSAREAVRGLLDLTPPRAVRVSADGSEREVLLDEVLPGDRIRVRPGERVAVDGIVVSGNAAIDESMVTGESMPVERGPGDPVIGGTLCQNGSLTFEATRVGKDTLLARIVQLVSEAQRSRAPVQSVADAVAARFVPAVVAVALVAFVLWALLGPEPRLPHALSIAVSVLIVACPCALGLATPLSVTVATARAARAGVLFRDAAAIQRMRDVDALVIDKTGTLTEGRPQLTTIRTFGRHGESKALAWAAAAERGSEHPLARALVEAAERAGAERLPADRFEARAGMGVRCEVDGGVVVVGNERMMLAEGVDPSPGLDVAETIRSQGGTAMFLARDGAVAAVFGVRDPIRPRAREARDALGRAGIRLIMATGDHQSTAMAVARALDIEDVHAQATPEDKAALVKELRALGHVVAMAGDGVNDAPALAVADVGIAMGDGTDIAVQSASIALLKGDLQGIARAIALSRAAMANIRQNLLLAFGYNALAVPVAAGALYPATGLLLSPMIAALAMTLSSASVVYNSLRLRSMALR